MLPISNAPYRDGAKDTLPLVFAAMPFGLVFGALCQAQGLPDWFTLCLSLFVYAGASQFIAATMLAAGAPVFIITITVFIVNLRHLLYGITLIPLVKQLPLKTRAWMAFFITDETFAVTARHLPGLSQNDEKYAKWLQQYYWGSSTFMYVNWVLCTAVGVLLGNQIPELSHYGLEVAMVVAFIGIVVPALQLPSHWICALVAGISACLTYAWPHKTGLLFSTFMAIAAGMWSQHTLFTQLPNKDPQS